jgi:hypothetical protein
MKFQKEIPESKEANNEKPEPKEDNNEKTESF